jgi:hypothetical protein
MKKRLVLFLEENELMALEVLAGKERRSPWQQAAVIIATELQKQGLIEQPAPILVVENKDEETQNDTAE